jgi:uncharacterized membrane protein
MGGLCVNFQDYEWIHLLILVHVLSAIIGIGPTFFGHVLFRKGQTVGQFRESMRMFELLGYFPRIVGMLAVLSGIGLVFAGDYSFTSFWIYGGLAIYVIIQIIFMGFAFPKYKKITQLLQSTDISAEGPVPATIVATISQINVPLYTCSILGVLLFLFMFFKPTI